MRLSDYFARIFWWEKVVSWPSVVPWGHQRPSRISKSVCVHPVAAFTGPASGLFGSSNRSKHPKREVGGAGRWGTKQVAAALLFSWLPASPCLPSEGEQTGICSIGLHCRYQLQCLTGGTLQLFSFVRVLDEVQTRVGRAGGWVGVGLGGKLLISGEMQRRRAGRD